MVVGLARNMMSEHPMANTADFVTVVRIFLDQQAACFMLKQKQKVSMLLLNYSLIAWQPTGWTSNYKNQLAQQWESISQNLKVLQKIEITEYKSKIMSKEVVLKKVLQE